MARRYEEAKGARFTAEMVEGVEQIRIPARRNWFAIAFLLFWLSGWTMGGLAAIAALLTHFQPFLVVWLCFWAVAVVMVTGVILWQLGGAETLRADGRDLEIGWTMPLFRRSRFYRGSEIRDLAASAPPDLLARLNGVSVPFLNPMNVGSVRFSYGARTVRAAAGLDEPEARIIVEQLRRRLPSCVVGAAGAEGGGAGIAGGA